MNRRQARSSTPSPVPHGIDRLLEGARNLCDFLLQRRTKKGQRRVILRKLLFLYQRGKWTRSVARRTRRPDRIPIDRPIFFLGVQGGGLTLLARTLVRNPLVCTASGNSKHWTASLDEIGLHRSRMRRLPPSLWHSTRRYDIEHPVFGAGHGFAYASDGLLPSYRRTPADATPEESAAFKRLIREHVLVYAHDPMHARFLDKTQTYTVSAGFVNALLEDCDPHFVLVVRNPYAVVYRAALWVYPELPFSHVEKLTLAAEHWENSFRLALADAERIEHFHVIRFEDFTSDPEAGVRGLCEFTGLDFDPEMVPQAHHRLPPDTWPPSDGKWYPIRPDRWLPRVPPKDAVVIDRRCGPLAERLGYERLGQSAADEGSLSARRQ